MYNAHRMLYKNEGVDSKELRRRREEEDVQLRKQKREMRVSKNRNIDKDNVPNVTPYQGYDWTYIKSMYSVNEEEQLQGAQNFRQFLLTLQESPLNDIININIIPQYVEFMKNKANSSLQFEAVWIVEYVSNGTSAQIQKLIENDVVSVLINMLDFSNDDTKELAVMCLGNIATKSLKYRDYVLNMGIMNPLLKLLSISSELQVIRNCVWVISSLCRGNSPPPNFTIVSLALPTLAKLLDHHDVLILIETCWALSYLSDGPKENIQAIIDTHICPSLVALLMHSQECVVIGALRAIGNILSGDENQSQIVLNCSILPCLRNLLGSSNQIIRKDICWIISNITAGNENQIQAVIEENVFPAIIHLIVSDEFTTKKEAVWAITNATIKGTQKQIQYLVDKDCIPALIYLLDIKDSMVIKIALNGLENILKAGDQLARQTKTVNQYANLIEECSGEEKLEILQAHKNTYINQKALEILECFFAVEEPDASIDQTTDIFYFTNQNVS